MRTPVTTTLAVLALVLAAAAPAAARSHDWTRFGFDPARSNSSSAVAGIRSSDLSHLHRQDVSLPGTVDSSPIYLHGVRVAGAKRDVFVVTTSYGRVLALDAGTGQILWSFAPASVGDLEGTYQITHSSPIADPNRRFVYSASPDGHIRKLSLATGAEVRSGSWPVRITLDPAHEKIGPPLNISGRYVIATTGGYNGDAPPYQGHIVLIDRKSGRLAHVFNALCSNHRTLIKTTSCSETGSAIWGRGGAVVVPGSHRILVTTGDGRFDGHRHWGDSVLELSSKATRLIGNWTPTNESDLDSGDVDLGSTAPALLRAGHRRLALQGGKDSLLRLLDVGNLNGHGRACRCKGGELQRVDSPGGSGVYTAPAVWRHGGKSWAFVANNAGTDAWRLDGGSAHPRLHRVWSADRSGTSPVLAGGLLYVYDPGGGVAVYKPASGRRVGTLDSDGGHWNIPIVVDGRIAVPTGDANDHDTTGTLTIYRK